MRAFAFLPRLGLAAALCLVAASAADAGERGFHGARHGGFGRVGPSALGYGYGGRYGAYGYGFADAAVNGAYIGAPYTRFPRPNELVPPAWGYGTYGVPTATGIQQAPAADPTVYVIDTPARASRSRVISRGSDGRWSEDAAVPAPSSGGARVVRMAVDGR